MLEKWGLDQIPGPGDPGVLLLLALCLSFARAGVTVEDLAWPRSSMTSLPSHDSPLWRF